jgi:hypothetical protein
MITLIPQLGDFQVPHVDSSPEAPEWPDAVRAQAGIDLIKLDFGRIVFRANFSS